MLFLKAFSLETILTNAYRTRTTTWSIYSYLYKLTHHIPLEIVAIFYPNLILNPNPLTLTFMIKVTLARIQIVE